MTTRVLAAIVLSALISGCGSSSSNSSSNSENTAVAFTAIACPAVSYQSAIEKQSQEVIDNAHRFVELYLATDLNSQEDEPTIDFDKKTVIALHMGVKPSAGYGLRVTQVQESETNIIINYEVESPGAGCGADAVITYPYCFIAIDKTENDVHFKSKEITKNCSSQSPVIAGVP